ncbi:MAG: DUF3108 domain-containing protein [Saprospiraceae bacterium]
MKEWSRKLMSYGLVLCLCLLSEHLNGKEAPFISGEKIVYKIFYNWNFVWLSAGEVSFEVKDEGSMYHIEVTGRTYSSYEWFYKVRDKFHSYIDKVSLKPVYYIRDIEEGSYQHYEKIVFDYASKQIHSHVGKSMNTTVLSIIPMQDDVYDLISTMYYLRSIDGAQMMNKKNVPFKMILDNEIYDLNIKYENQSNLDVKESGSYRVLNYIVDVITGNVFRNNTSLKINVADDKNNLPLVIESPLSVGSVKAILKFSDKLKHPFSSKL